MSRQIVILGMHRSGTSFLGKCLHELGIFFAPDNLDTGANRENKLGFFERRDIRALNDLLLFNEKSDWQNPYRFISSEPQTDALEKFENEAIKILHELSRQRVFFIKEPRFCLTIKHWDKLLSNPLYIYIHRDPRACAKSLVARNNFTQEHAQALWCIYNQSVLKFLKGKPTISVSAEELFTNTNKTIDKICALAKKHFGLELKRATDLQKISTPSSLIKSANVKVANDQINSELHNRIIKLPFFSQSLAMPDLEFASDHLLLLNKIDQETTDQQLAILKNENDGLQAKLTSLKKKTEASDNLSTAIEKLHSELHKNGNQHSEILQNISNSAEKLAHAKEELQNEVSKNLGQSDALFAKSIEASELQLKITNLKYLQSQREKNTERLEAYQHNLESELLSKTLTIAELDSRHKVLEAELKNASKRLINAQRIIDKDKSASILTEKKILGYQFKTEQMGQLCKEQKEIIKKVSAAQNIIEAKLEAAKQNIEEKSKVILEQKLHLNLSNEKIQNLENQLLTANESNQEIEHLKNQNQQQLNLYNEKIQNLENQLLTANESNQEIEHLKNQNQQQLDLYNEKIQNLENQLLTANESNQEIEHLKNQNQQQLNLYNEKIQNLENQLLTANKTIERFETFIITKLLQLSERQLNFLSALAKSRTIKWGAKIQKSLPRNQHIDIKENLLKRIEQFRAELKFIRERSWKQIETTRQPTIINSSIKQKIVVYTAIIGGYDNLLKYRKFVKEYDYVCISDTISPGKYGNWDVKKIPDHINEEINGIDNTKKARFLKTHPHLLFPEHDIAVWIDSNILIEEDLGEYVDGFIKSGAEIGTFRHGDRSNIVEEGHACIEAGKDDATIIEAQIKHYKDSVFRMSDRLYETNILISAPNLKSTKELSEAWWKQIFKWSKRDQISLPFLLQLMDRDVYELEADTSNNPRYNNKNKIFFHKHDTKRYRDIDPALIVDLGQK